MWPPHHTLWSPAHTTKESPPEYLTPLDKTKARDDTWAMNIDVYGLNQHTLYRIPASSVSYHPRLANRHAWFTGRYRSLPAQGGTMAEFCLAGIDAELVWLRPFAVVSA